MCCIVERCRILDRQHCFLFSHSFCRLVSMRSTNRFWGHLLVIQETRGGLGRCPASTSLWNTCLRLRCNSSCYLNTSLCEPFISKMSSSSFLLCPDIRICPFLLY